MVKWDKLFAEFKMIIVNPLKYIYIRISEPVTTTEVKWNSLSTFAGASWRCFFFNFHSVVYNDNEIPIWVAFYFCKFVNSNKSGENYILTSKVQPLAHKNIFLWRTLPKYDPGTFANIGTGNPSNLILCSVFKVW